MSTKQVTTKKKVVAKTPDKPMSEVYAELSISSSFMNAAIAESFAKGIMPKVQIIDLAKALKENFIEVHNGDMTSIEAMLIGQAQALQTMFVTLGLMAASKTQIAQYTAFMNMALKAQSQSRATIQALTDLKYPKQATFVKQANISHGHQQVNNSIDGKENSRVEDFTNESNELLSGNNNATLDTRRTATASKANQAVAAMEAKYRSEND